LGKTTKPQIQTTMISDYYKKVYFDGKDGRTLLYEELISHLHYHSVVRAAWKHVLKSCVHFRSCSIFNAYSASDWLPSTRYVAGHIWSPSRCVLILLFLCSYGHGSASAVSLPDVPFVSAVSVDIRFLAYCLYLLR